MFIIILGVDVANERNAGSFSRGITKVFDFPIDIISDAFERGWGWYPLLLKYFPTLLSTVNMAILTVDKRVGKYLSNSGYHPQPLSNASLIISIGKSKTFVIPLLKLPALRSFATSTPRIMMNTIDSMKIIV